MFESERGNNVCVVADDTDVYILLLYAAHQFQSKIYFRQGKQKDKAGITYHEVIPLAKHLGKRICNILPAYHALTGCDYTMPFFGRTKFTCFKRMLSHPETCDLLESLNTESGDATQIIEFILRVIYNRPNMEKTPGQARYKMLFVGKGKKKKFASTKAIIPDKSTLVMKSKRTNFVTHLMVNCLEQNFVPLNPSDYAWKKNDDDDRWSPIWFEGSPLPSTNDVFEGDDSIEVEGVCEAVESGDEEYPSSGEGESSSDNDSDFD